MKQVLITIPVFILFLGTYLIAHGQPIPVSQVLDEQGFLKRGTVGKYQSTGFAVQYDKNKKQFAFTKNNIAASSANSFDLINVVNDSVLYSEKNSLVGLITKNGAVKTPQYSEIKPFSDHVFMLYKNNLVGYYNDSSKREIPCEYNFVDFMERWPYVYLLKKENKYFFIKPEVPEIVSPSFISMVTYYKGIQMAKVVTTNFKLGLINLNTKKMADSLDAIEPSGKNYFRVKKKGEEYNIDYNFSKVKEYEELGNDKYYLTVIVEESFAKKAEDQTVYVMLYSGDPNPVSYPGKLSISGFVNAGSDLPYKYPNPANCIKVNYITTCSGRNGYITVVLPRQNYTYTVKKGTYFETIKVNGNEKNYLSVASNIKHFVIRLN